VLRIHGNPLLSYSQMSLGKEKGKRKKYKRLNEYVHKKNHAIQNRLLKSKDNIHKFSNLRFAFSIPFQSHFRKECWDSDVFLK
jgi:hypothetical protein